MARRTPGDGAGKPAPSTLPFVEQVSSARQHALRLLASRERSAMELRARLRQRGYGPEAIVAALDRLQEARLQSDERFADRYVSEAVAKGKSARLIQGELRARGIDKEAAAVAATAGPDEERARATELARRRAPRLSDLSPAVAFRRLTGLLARRGYDPDTCRSVAEAVLGAPDEAFLDRDSGPDVP